MRGKSTGPRKSSYTATLLGVYGSLVSIKSIAAFNFLGPAGSDTNGVRTQLFRRLSLVFVVDDSWLDCGGRNAATKTSPLGASSDSPTAARVSVQGTYTARPRLCC